jgi:four helix bundle protein
MNRTKPFELSERTFLFACDIVSFCLVLSQRPGAHRQIAGQLLRAGTSVGANQEEAKAAYTPRDFACRNSIVLREARETRFWLRLVVATGLSTDTRLAPLLAEANELVAIYITTVRKAKLSAKVHNRKPRPDP